MLEKERRIGKNFFRDIFRSGKSFSAASLSLKTAPAPSGKSRFAFVVSGKVSKKSVERNKLKRRARTIIAKNVNSIQEGYSFVFIFLKKSLGLTFKELEKEILSVLDKARAIKK